MTVSKQLFCLSVAAGLLIASRAHADDDSYYSRARGLGIFHKAHLTIGGFMANVPPTIDETSTSTELESKLAGSIEFDVSYLGLASAYGNFHGIETFMGILTEPFDLYWGFGMPVTFLNIGRGGPGTLRLGGSYGAGLSYRQAFLYLRGRAAAVIVPETVDVQASCQWVPESVSHTWSGDGSFEDMQLRASFFYRPNKGKNRAYELYIQYFERERRGHSNEPQPGEPFDGLDVEGEVNGFGIGVGMTLF